MAPIPRILGDFAVLPVTIPPLPSFPKEATHHLYLRRNAPKIPTETDSRSLFIANVPVDSTEEHIRAVIVALVGAGRFEGITFENESKHGNTASDNLPGHAAKLAALTKKRKRGSDSAQRADEVAAAKLPLVWARPLRRSGSTAVVLMADDKSVDLVLKAVDKVHKTRKFPVWGQGVPESTPGLGSKWLRAHQKLSYPDADLLQASVDAFFTLFNQHEIEAAELAKRLRSEPDEDGFVTVTRGSRTAPAKQSEAEEARRKMLEKEEKKKNELGNFYRFQHRERRKAEQADLLRRFEEDKKKVAAFREKRSKFRPES